MRENPVNHVAPIANRSQLPAVQTDEEYFANLTRSAVPLVRAIVDGHDQGAIRELTDLIVRAALAKSATS